MGRVGLTKISPVQHHKISSISIKDKVINDIIKNGSINNDELNVKSSQFDNSSNHCLSDNCLTFENKLFYFFEKMILFSPPKKYTFVFRSMSLLGEIEVRIGVNAWLGGASIIDIEPNSIPQTVIVSFAE